MSLNQWAINRNSSRIRKIELKKVHDRVEAVIQHLKTAQKKLLDFASVNDYLLRKFPTVDISDIKLYLVEPSAMTKSGWKDIGGCYIPSLQLIITKKKIHNSRRPSAKKVFARLMYDSFKMKTDVEDVIIHESIHAVSHKLGRSSRRFTHMEEEFVYTNCVDFYKEKGMSESDIVDNNFLPFCMHDVQKSREKMSCIYKDCGSSLGEVEQMSEREYDDFCNANANVLVSSLKREAQSLGHDMIVLYNQYGEEMHKTQRPESDRDVSSLRFSSLDLEDF